MTKLIRSVYIEQSVWERAQEVFGERGVSNAIEKALTAQLYGLMYACKSCGAEFSEKTWERMPDKRGTCISCGAGRSNLEIVWQRVD